MARAKKLRVAGVQIQSHNGEVEANLTRAEPFVAEAAGRGAELVLCPEFLAAGYIYDESIWSCSETQSGATETWLRRQAGTHGIYLGASYLEADGDDFYNTFTLAAPDGSVAGRVRKESLPAFEGWYFKSCEDPKIIDTELGRIAVGICQDNHTARFFRRVLRDDPDLILMPHSAPCTRLGAPVMRHALKQIAPYYARAFGVPVVLVNKVHARCLTPIPGIPYLRLSFDFPGLSSICDSDGVVVDQLPDREGIVVADVLLDPARKSVPDNPTSFYWSRRPRFHRILGAAFVALEHLGKRAYAKNEGRPSAARATFEKQHAQPSRVASARPETTSA